MIAKDRRGGGYTTIGFHKALRRTVNLLSFDFGREHGTVNPSLNRVGLCLFSPSVVRAISGSYISTCEALMSSPGIAPISVVLEGFSGTGRAATPALLSAMLRAADKISDLIFSPGRPPQVQVYGQLIPVQVP